ncbi:tubulin-folding cofactor B-like [Oscarella lobularis]|uniref:tubulin-folding cofactor B-like n=1 Tax=Oscarella lobularis TaxID=121494 RepID=UPI003314244A
MDDVISVRITSSVSTFGSERRFPASTKVVDLKGKLELITGASCRSMELDLFDRDDQFVRSLQDDDATLESASVASGMRVHVTDREKRAGEFDDLSAVPKYEMKDDEYAKRSDSVRAFKERMKLGRFNPEAQAQKDEEMKKEKDAAELISVGSRCEVRVTGNPLRRGTVAYVGETGFKPGYWVGIRYDEPVGKHDGCVGGKRYFECDMKYGGFVKPKCVTVGDFPVEGIDDEDEI